MRMIFLYCALFLNCVIGALNRDTHSAFFNTSFLSNFQRVCARLKNSEGFVEGYFKTDDGLNLNYLWLARPDAHYSVICCAGFWPGRKEGIATMYALLPTDCNILFFDARGHGKSDGHLWRKVFNYGIHESKDVQAALSFVHSCTDVPIIVWGVCAGAYHSAHALLELEKSGELNSLNVAGLVFDSGWSLMPEVAATSFASEFKKVTLKKLKSFPSLVKKAIQIAAIQPIGMAVETSMRSFFSYFLASQVYRRELAAYIEKLTVPTLFIHAQSDSYASFKTAKKLAKLAPKATCWWIKRKSVHACHHLKHTDEYGERLKLFIALNVSVSQ